MHRRRSPLRDGGLALALAAAAAAGSGCTTEATTTDAARVEPPRFVDVAREAGIHHRHRKPVLDPKLANIMSWMASVGAAVAAGDFDGDGWIDFYATSSHREEPNYLYRNNHDGTFTDVAPQVGLDRANGEAGASMDAVWGDYDNDGDADLYLVRWGRDSLYRNDGGVFTEVSEALFRRRDGAAGIDWANGNAAIFFDYDRDGRLDVYVGNYFKPVDLWNLEDTRVMHDDFERSRNGGANFLYRQQEDGTFAEVAGKLGVDDPGWTLAVGAADLDADGWPDLYCADDFGPDQLFLNDGAGGFVNVSETALGYDTKKGMNVDFGDFNSDGWLDVFVTNITTAEYLQEGNMLWLNQGRGEDGVLTLTDIALEAGTYDGGWGWGGKFFDYDNDADLDIVSVNGFISAGEGSYWYDLATWTVVGDDPTDSRNWPPIGDRSFSGYEKTRLFRNDGLYSFTERAAAEGVASDRDGRGVAALDYDNDGDLDLFVANQDQSPHLYRNQRPGTGHWLMVDLETDPATAVNRDGIGTRVTLTTAGRLLVRERDGGNGYAAQSDPRLHFGLGGAERVDLVEVRWPDGGLQYLEDVAADQVVAVRQDPGRYVEGSAFEIAAPSWRPPERTTQPAPPAVEPAELERQLTEMEGRLGSLPLDRALASTYRSRAATYGEHDRAIRFLEELIAKREAEGGDVSRLRVELSLAYIDKIPTCGGLAAIVCKGSLAKKGLDQTDLVLAEHPDSWLALYSRGMNHLHWPRALRHSDDAAADLERCAALQESRDGEPEGYDHRTWVALGQAYAKDGRFAEARRAWNRGLEVFPDSEELREHLAVADDEALLALVKEKRSLEQPIDTDVSFYGGEI
jgi:hypothetical protein